MPGKFLGIVGQDLSDYESNRLHVDIFRLSFIYLRYTESMNSSKMFGNYLAILNFNRLFLKLNESTCWFN